MKIARGLIPVCFAVLIQFPLHSAGITVLINQQDGVHNTVRDVSLIFEDAVMNYFFNQGAIISNEPVSVEKNVQASYLTALDASVRGYIDYLILFTVFVDPVQECVLSADWKVVQTSDAHELDTGKMTVPAAKNTSDEKENLRQFAAQCAAAASKQITLW